MDKKVPGNIKPKLHRFLRTNHSGILGSCKRFVKKWTIPIGHFKNRRKRLFRISVASGLIILLGIVGFGFYYVAAKPNYQLSARAVALVGTPDHALVAKELTYDTKTRTYVLNKAGIGQQQAANTASVGDNTNDAYSLKIPTVLDQGVTFYDNQTGLSFTLAPQFKTNSGKNIAGQFVYPLGSGNVQAVYTIKQNGLKEDIVLNKAIGPTAKFSYKLELPSYLQARMLPSGAVGIYSANPYLFGNISYGSSSDKQLITRAKLNSPKDNLVFALMPPTVVATSGSNHAKASLSLHGSSLSMNVSGLNDLQYPVSIDPSVVVASASTFGQSGNNEGDLSLNPSSNQISEAGLTGGTLGASWSSVTSLTHSTYSASSVAYNGYLYLIGGYGSGLQSAVYYAPINSNGTLGSWTATTSLQYPTDEATAVAYNGYIYFMGGDDTFYGTSAADYSAQISSSGALGNWNIVTSLPNATYGATSVVNNGYIYEIGGNTYNGVSGAITTTVDYVPIEANGTLGSWTATTSLGTATQFATSTVYNGYVYEIGGWNGVGGSSPYTTVDYALINSNGTLGSWTATTSLPTGTFIATSVVYDGYIYEIGGSSQSSTLSTVEYASIDSDGTLGSWNSTTSLSAATDSSTSVAYNGYLYELGGNLTSNSYDIAIEPAGYLSTPTTTTSLPTATRDATAVAYNGYLYELGGNTGSYSSTVDYATISNGTVGTWSSTTSIPTALSFIGSVAYNGNIYIVGGYNGSSTAVVDYGKITASTGAISSWTATTSLPTATNFTTVAAYNGYLYEIGGSTAGGNTSTVDYATINNNGSIGSWTATSSLPNATNQASSAVYNGYVYEIGGSNPFTTTTVDYAQINSNGTLGSWTATSSLPNSLYDATSVAANGYLYEIGGCGNTCPVSTIDYAQINSNGTLGSWTATNNLTTATQSAAAAVYNGYIYQLGGFDGSSILTTVEYLPINNGGPGTVGSWTATSSLPTSLTNATTVAYNGYLYEIGGCQGTGSCPTSVVDYAPINSSGTLGSWTATSSLPTALNFAASVVYNGYMYEIGGENSTPADVVTVDYAQINSNGTLGSWTATSSLPTAAAQITAETYKGYVYAIGLQSGNVVDYAPINSSGTLGSWTATSSLPYDPNDGSSATYDGYMYEAGGFANTVDYAQINSNGTLGSWTATSSLLQAMGNATMITYNGYIYMIGGYVNSAISNVEYAAINSDGTLGAWTYTTSLPNKTWSSGSIALNGFVYEVGGTIGTNPTANVNYAGLDSIPRVGIYSALVDVTGLSNDDPNPTYLITYGSNTGNPGIGVTQYTGTGGITLQYQFASNACTTFNSQNSINIDSINTLSSPLPATYTIDACSNTTNLGRYMFIRYLLDDSQTASFPDANSNHSSVTDFTLYYHPAAGHRLRGGATFSNQSLQSLDAQP